MADTTVSIGADLSELRKQLAKLPDLAAGAAQKTLIEIEKTVVKAEKAVKKSNAAAAKAVGRGSKAAGDSLRDFGDKAGDADSALKDLAGALGIVSPELDTFLTRVGDLSGGIEGVTKLNTRLGLSLARVAAIVAPIALLVAGIAAGWGIYAQKQREATDASKLQKTILDKLVPLTRKLADVRADLAVVTGVMTTKERALIDARKDAHAAFIENTSELSAEIGLRAAELRDLEARIEEMPAATTSLRDGVTIDPKGIAEAQAVKLAAGLEILRAQFAGAIATTKATVKATEDLANATADAADEVDRLREAKAAASAAADAQREAEQALAAAVATVQGVMFSALSKTEQEAAGLLAEMAELLDIQAQFPALSGDVAAALAVLEERLRNVGEAGADGSNGLLTLRDTIESLAPSKTRLDELEDALLQATLAVAFLGVASGISADDIARLRGELDKARAAADKTSNDAPTTFFERLGEAAEVASARVSRAMSGIRSAVGGAIGLFDTFLQMVGGFSLADLAEVATQGTITRDVLDAQGNVTGTETVGPGQVVEEMAAGGVAAVATFVASIPDVVDALLAALPTLFSAAQDAIGPLFKTAADALPGFLALIIDEGPKLVSSIIAEVPRLFSVIVEQLPSLILKLGEGVGDILVDILDAVPVIVADLIAELPRIVTAINLALPSILTKLTVALLKLPAVLIDELVENAIEAGREVIAWAKSVADAGIVPYFKDLLKKIGPVLQAWIVDLFGVGGAAPPAEAPTTFGDTPGAVRAGLQGLAARFAPGDTVVAAQDTDEVLRQAQAAAGVGGGSPSRVVLDLQDGHLAFFAYFARISEAAGRWRG